MTQVSKRAVGGTRNRSHAKTADGGRVVIDDTLVTEAVFAMTPAEILGDAADPEGLQIGERSAQEIRRRLVGTRKCQG